MNDVIIMIYPLFSSKFIIFCILMRYENFHYFSKFTFFVKVQTKPKKNNWQRIYFLSFLYRSEQNISKNSNSIMVFFILCHKWINFCRYHIFKTTFALKQKNCPKGRPGGMMEKSVSHQWWRLFCTIHFNFNCFIFTLKVYSN